MSPQLAGGLTALVGMCMVAGWLAAFRNRAYLGLLGLGFLTISGFLLALAKAIEKLASDSQRRKQLAEKGRARAEEFTAESMNEKINRLYDELLQIRGLRA